MRNKEQVEARLEELLNEQKSLSEEDQINFGGELQVRIIELM